MRIVFLSSFPFFDVLTYKKKVIQNISTKNPDKSELALLYSHKAIKDHYKMWKNNFDLARTFFKSCHKILGPSDATEEKEELGYDRSRLSVFVKERKIIVKHFNRFNEGGCLTFLNQFEPEIIFNFSGEYIPKDILNIPFWGVIGAHYGLLPQIRGRDTIRWSILSDYPLYVCHMKLSEEIDMGDVILRTSIPVYKKDNYQEIRKRCQSASASGFINIYDLIVSGNIKIEIQKKNDGSTFYLMGRYLRDKIDRILSHGLYKYTQD